MNAYSMFRILPLVLAGLAISQSVRGAAPVASGEQKAYADWKRANPNQAAKITELKSGTAAAIAAARPINGNTQIDEPPMVWRVPNSLTEIWDTPDAPVMIVVPAGEFTMGSRTSEARSQASERPRHRVRIAYPFAVSKYRVTVADYGKFIAQTGYGGAATVDTAYSVQHQCFSFKDGKWEILNRCNWQNPGFPQDTDYPVVTVNWEDARHYAQWLSEKTGHRYRLLSEAEYEYADRAGTDTLYWWGDQVSAACSFANGADLDARQQFPDWIVNDCHDGVTFTAAAKKFPANQFGLHAMTGNAWTWLQDCWSENYENTPSDGSPNSSEKCQRRVIRGGSWADAPESLRAASRGWNYPEVRFSVNGFRVARDL